jgi:UvrD/REP helicase N-terminal domain
MPSWGRTRCRRAPACRAGTSRNVQGRAAARAGAPAHRVGGLELCVVGDEDQAIYQWGGSDVRNIVEFTDRQPSVHTFTVTVNRRSRTPNLEAAAPLANSIPSRLDLEMGAFRSPVRTGGVEVVVWTPGHRGRRWRWHRGDDQATARQVAAVPARRGPGARAAAYPRLLKAFDAHSMPVRPASEGRAVRAARGADARQDLCLAGGPPVAVRAPHPGRDPH